MKAIKTLPPTDADTFVIIHSPETNKGIIYPDWESEVTSKQLIEFAVSRAILFADENGVDEVTYTIIDRRNSI